MRSCLERGIYYDLCESYNSLSDTCLWNNNTNPSRSLGDRVSRGSSVIEANMWVDW